MDNVAVAYVTYRCDVGGRRHQADLRILDSQAMRRTAGWGGGGAPQSLQEDRLTHFQCIIPAILLG